MRWIERLLRYRRRSLTFTPLGTRFILVTLAIGLAAINTGNNLLYLVLALMLSLITLSGILSELCLRHLALVRRLAPSIFASEPTPVTVAVTNHKRLVPSFLLRLGEAAGDGSDGSSRSVALDPPVFVLPPGVSRSVTYRLTFERRGLHQLAGVVASTKFPFGLFTKRLMVPLAQEVCVFPALLPGQELTGLINPLGQELARARRGHGGGFFVLRDYLDGDDARTIHWKSSARQARLLVREADEEEHREVTLVLERSWPSESATARDAALYHARFERAVSLAATLAMDWMRRGWRLGLIAEERHLAPALGRAHLEQLLRTLALQPPLSRPGVAEHERGAASPAQLLHQRAHDDLWVVLMVWDHPDWASGDPNLHRRVVTCPNEPARAEQGEE
jgi:uncharacterized protein (DUF58 family)